MTDRERAQDFRDIVLWQQEGLDIEKQHCLFINFGANMKFEYSQIRKGVKVEKKSLMIKTL